VKLQDVIETAIAHIRSKVEHPFRAIKQQFGFQKDPAAWPAHPLQRRPLSLVPELCPQPRLCMPGLRTPGISTNNWDAGQRARFGFLINQLSGVQGVSPIDLTIKPREGHRID